MHTVLLFPLKLYFSAFIIVLTEWYKLLWHKSNDQCISDITTTSSFRIVSNCTSAMFLYLRRTFFLFRTLNVAGYYNSLVHGHAGLRGCYTVRRRSCRRPLLPVVVDFVLNNSGHKKVLKQEEMGLNAQRAAIKRHYFLTLLVGCCAAAVEASADNKHCSI